MARRSGRGERVSGQLFAVGSLRQRAVLSRMMSLFLPGGRQSPGALLAGSPTEFAFQMVQPVEGNQTVVLQSTDYYAWSDADLFCERNH